MSDAEREAIWLGRLKQADQRAEVVRMELQRANDALQRAQAELSALKRAYAEDTEHLREVTNRLEQIVRLVEAKR